MAEKKLKTLQFEGLNITYVLPEVDPTSSISGDAADAKIVGDHLVDKNNPHNVTIAQIGAAPAGLITELINVANEAELETVLSAKFAPMRNRTMAHFYINPSTQDVFNGKATLCELTCWTVSSGGYGFARFTSYGKPNTIISYKSLYGGVWQPMEDGSTTAFAPSGYGYGGIVPYYGVSVGESVDDFIDNMTANWKDGEVRQIRLYDGNFYANSMLLTVFKYSANATIINGMTGDKFQVSKNKISGAWNPWEWVNPPMVLGVEYRTTERYEGKPVYTLLFNAGLMADGKQVDIPNLTASYMIIRRNETFNNGLPLPWFYSYGNKNIKVEYNKSSSENKYYAIFDSHSDIGANYTVNIQLWYTK